uniref:Nuclear receptor domain-containing protein n=1 Tax=Chinchilla lanigera TaxID=34839 RepID=A0A8C2VY20_CHILA
MAYTSVTTADRYGLAEPMQCYDIWPEQVNYRQHNTDFQETPYCHYSTAQFPPALQSQHLSSNFNTYSLNHSTVIMDSVMEGSRPTCSSRKKGQEEVCVVCSDKASGYHYNALTCEGCKGFFRRSITKNAGYDCKNGGHCEIDMYMRRKRRECRLKTCGAVGMLAECNTEVQCNSKRLRKNIKQNSFHSNTKVEEKGTDNKLVSSIRKTMPENANPKLRFLQLSEKTTELQIGSKIEMMFLHVKNDNHNMFESVLCSDENTFFISTFLGIIEEFITSLFYFYRRMSGLNVSDTKYAVLAATTVLFSSKSHLQVENLQEPILHISVILYKYSKIYHAEDPQHFACLIGMLTELSTLSHNYSEILSTWKMKNPKLTALFSGKWNLYSHC